MDTDSILLVENGFKENQEILKLEPFVEKILTEEESSSPGPSNPKRPKISLTNSNPENNLKSDNEVRQLLTYEEIQLLKESGIKTSTLVSKLVDGNSAFYSRTEYSQVKYVEKKTKKHSHHVLILKPTIRLLNECYYKRQPERIANLRYSYF